MIRHGFPSTPRCKLPQFSVGIGPPNHCRSGSAYADLSSGAAYVWGGSAWHPLRCLPGAVPHGHCAPSSPASWPPGTKQAPCGPPTQGSMYLSLCEPAQLFAHNGHKWVPVAAGDTDNACGSTSAHYPTASARPVGFGWPSDVSPRQTCVPSEGSRLRVDGTAEVYGYTMRNGWELLCNGSSGSGGPAWLPVVPCAPQPGLQKPWPVCPGSKPPATGDVVIADGCLYYYDAELGWQPSCCPCKGDTGTGDSSLFPLAPTAPTTDKWPPNTTGRPVRDPKPGDSVFVPGTRTIYIFTGNGWVPANGPATGQSRVLVPQAAVAPDMEVLAEWPGDTYPVPDSAPQAGDALFAGGCMHVCGTDGLWHASCCECTGDNTAVAAPLAVARRSFSDMKGNHQHELLFTPTPVILNTGKYTYIGPQLPRAAIDLDESTGVFTVHAEGQYDISLRFMTSGNFGVLTPVVTGLNYPAVSVYVNGVVVETIYLQPFYGGYVGLASYVANLHSGETVDVRYAGDIAGDVDKLMLTQWEILVRQRTHGFSLASGHQ